MTKNTFHIFESLKAHIYEPSISLTSLMLIMQNPDYQAELLLIFIRFRISSIVFPQINIDG